MKNLYDKDESSEDNLLHKAKYHSQKCKLPKNKLFIIAVIMSLAIIAIIVTFYRFKILSANQYGCTLPGATEINPAVMYNDTTYYWKNMAAPACKMPQGELPQGYKYTHDIEYVDTGKLTENYQFTATFSASGKLYVNEEDPNNVCICITTFWLKDAYVIFSKEK